MANSISMAQNGKAFTEKKTFSRTTTITQSIDADAAIIWALLTNATDMARWNSTIVSLEGTIAADEKIKLVSTIDSSRTFKLKIKNFTSEQKLAWGDAMGTRIFILKETDGKVQFTMTEKIGGLIFPLFAKQIPSFDESFEQFTADLKKEAEFIAKE